MKYMAYFEDVPCNSYRESWKLAYLVLGDDLPAPCRGGVRGGTLEHHVGGAVQHGAVCQVRVSSHPPAVSSAPAERDIA